MSNEKRLRIVLADDEGHCRLLMKAILNSMGCEVVAEATTGEDAIRLYRELRPNILLLDVNMPIRTGDEVLTKVLEDFPDALVIMLTSVTDMESIERCIALGAANYIRKDTPVAEIKSLIKETWIEYVRNKREAAA